jgi:hypothetical protein
MNVFNWIIGGVLVLTMTGGCTTGARVQSSFDKQQDFSRFQTYNFSSATERVDPDFHEMLGLAFSAAVEQQMILRGYSRSANPDLLIGVEVDVEDKRRAPNQIHACPSYTSNNNANISSAVIDGQTRGTYCRFTEGPVMITIVESGRNKTIWQGQSQVRIDERERGVLLSAFIADDVRVMFSDAPFSPIKKPEIFVQKDRVRIN